MTETFEYILLKYFLLKHAHKIHELHKGLTTFHLRGPKLKFHFFLFLQNNISINLLNINSFHKFSKTPKPILTPIFFYLGLYEHKNIS